MVASLFVAARAEGDSKRMHRHLETLLRSMELPYFIIERLSKFVNSAARKHGWAVVKQENFQGKTVYDFQKIGGSAVGRLVVSDDEFKRVWLLEKDDQVQTIDERLFGKAEPDLKEETTREDKYLNEVIRQAISEEVEGPHWIGISHQPDGTSVFTLGQNQGDAEQPFLVISSERRHALGAMIPIQRYAAGANDAKVALQAFLK